MAVNRKTHVAHSRCQNKNFDLQGLEGFAMHGKTVVVLGAGNIGICAAKIYLGFGCKVLYYNRSAKKNLSNRPSQGFTQSHCSRGSATDANVGGTGNHHHSFSQPSSRAQDSNSHRDSIFDGINQCIDGDVMWIESSKKDFKPWPGVVFRSWDCLEKVCMLCVCV